MCHFEAKEMLKVTMFSDFSILNVEKTYKSTKKQLSLWTNVYTDVSRA